MENSFFVKDRRSFGENPSFNRSDSSRENMFNESFFTMGDEEDKDGRTSSFDVRP